MQCNQIIQISELVLREDPRELTPQRRPENPCMHPSTQPSEREKAERMIKPCKLPGKIIGKPSSNRENRNKHLNQMQPESPYDTSELENDDTIWKFQEKKP